MKAVSAFVLNFKRQPKVGKNHLNIIVSNW